MRIAIFSEVYWPMVSGVSNTLFRTVEGLTQRGHDVRVYSATYDLPPGIEDRPEVYRARSRPLFLSREVQWASPRLRDVIGDLERFQPSVVHLATEFAMGQAGLRAAGVLGLPIVASAHTDYERYATRYGVAWALWPGLMYLKRFYRNASVVLAPSRDYERHLNRRGIRHTAIWSRGVDTDRLSSAFRSQRYRSALGVAPNDELVAYVGRIAPEKGIERLLAAWARLSRARPNAHLVFTGTGVMETEIKARGLPRVHFTGLKRGAELATAYASADGFVLPSTTETFGNVLLEAMASGVPSVAMARGGVLDYAVDRENVLLVRHPSADHLAAALDELLGNPELRRTLARGARATAMARTWDAVFDDLAGHYRRAAGRGLATAA